MKKEYIIVIAFGILLVAAVFLGRSTVKPEYINIIPDSTAAYINKLKLERDQYRDSSLYWEGHASISDSLKNEVIARFNYERDHEKPDNYTSIAVADFEQLLRTTLTLDIINRQFESNDIDNLGARD